MEDLLALHVEDSNESEYDAILANDRRRRRLRAPASSAPPTAPPSSDESEAAADLAVACGGNPVVHADPSDTKDGDVKTGLVNAVCSGLAVDKATNSTLTETKKSHPSAEKRPTLGYKNDGGPSGRKRKRVTPLVKLE